MARCLAALLIFMSGCGGNEPPNDNHGYGFQYDEVGPGGLHLRQSAEAAAQPCSIVPAIQPATGMRQECPVHATELEDRARAVGVCLGVDAPVPPFVIVVPSQSLGETVAGQYYRAPPLILLDERFADVVFDHEALHYLLDYSTGDSDPTHQNPAWVACAT